MTHLQQSNTRLRPSKTSTKLAVVSIESSLITIYAYFALQVNRRIIVHLAILAEKRRVRLFDFCWNQQKFLFLVEPPAACKGSAKKKTKSSAL